MYKVIAIKDNIFSILDTKDGVVDDISYDDLLDLIQNKGIKVSNVEEQRYAFVLDIRGVVLSPTKEQKAWYMIRHGKAKLIQQNPMVIQLLREQLSKVEPEIVAAEAEPGIAIMSSPTEQTHLIASSFSIESAPALTASIIP